MMNLVFTWRRQLFHRNMKLVRIGDLCKTQTYLMAVLLCVGVVFVIFLALGTNGPGEGLALRVVRKLAPPYKMIRQPLKVLCLMPVLLAPIFALFLNQTKSLKKMDIEIRKKMYQCLFERVYFRVVDNRLFFYTACLLLIAFSTWDVSRNLRLAVCRIPQSNPVYAAIVGGRDSDEPPNVLCLPIWPGDSAWSSLYQLNSMLHKVRMVNGYSAVCSPDYIENVYRAFEPITQGLLGDAEYEALRKFGVTDILLYTDAFPENVSPFPVENTSLRLELNPRLEFVEDAESPSRILRFKVLDEDEFKHVEVGDEDFPSFMFPMSPARRWSSIPGTDGAAGINPTNAVARTRSPVYITDNLAWHVRFRETPGAVAE